MPESSASQPVGSVLSVTGFVVLTLIVAFVHGSPQEPRDPATPSRHV